MIRGGARLLAVALLVGGFLVIGVGTPADAVPESRVATGDPDPGRRSVIVVVLHGVSFGQAWSTPQVRDLAAVETVAAYPSGAALLVEQGSIAEQLERIDGLASPVRPSSSARVVDVPMEEGGDPVARTLRKLGFLLDDGTFRGAFVIVVGTDPSPAMQKAKDDVLPLFAGTIDAPAAGPPRALTSDATRRDGVVSSLDLLPTVTAALGRPLPDEGARIGATDEPAPEALYERYLQMRRLTVPVQAAAWIYTLVAGLVLGGLAWVRARDPERVSDALAGRARWLAPSVVPLAVGMLAAGHLPLLTYPVVIPFLIVVTIAGTAWLLPFARRGRLAPIAALGWAVLAALAIETAMGWSAALTPLLGGSQLDGGRFFGMPNVAMGIAIGSAAYVATRLPLGGAVAVFAGTVAVMGLPWTGANIGAAIAGSAALGLWVAQRERDGLDLRGLLLAAGITIGGAVTILAIHRFAPGAPTHGARFVEGGLGGPLGVALDRLREGFDLLVSSPAAVIPVAGILVLVAVGLRPGRSVEPVFEAEPALRALVLTVALSGIIAYLVEDSGAGASGMFFALGLAALFHVSLPLADRQDRATR